MYVKVTNNVLEKYPYSTGELIQSNPNTSFPATLSDSFLAEWGVYRIATTSIPSYNRLTESPEQGQPVLVNGVWTQTWNIRQATAEEQAQRIESIRNDIVGQAQQRLDTFAQTRNYDGILSLCSYATSTDPKFAAEGQYGVQIRDATWKKLYEILEEVQNNTRPMPEGYASIESELPPLMWPI